MKTRCARCNAVIPETCKGSQHGNSGCFLNACKGIEEETGKWVILDYFPNSPTHIYGFFDSEAEARAFAARQGMGNNGGAYSVHTVLNAHYQVRREPWE